MRVSMFAIVRDYDSGRICKIPDVLSKVGAGVLLGKNLAMLIFFS